MAAGRASVSASREQVASRRPTRAPFFNEKEYFYRQRVLRRARKMAASFARSGIPASMVSLDTAAALAVRCSQLEWSAAVAHYNASFLHERLCRVEAAAGVPPLPFPAASPVVQPGESTAGFRHDSAHAAAASGEADAVDAAAEGRSEQPVVWPAEPAAVQPAAPYVAQSAGMDSGASEPEEPTTTSKDAGSMAAVVLPQLEDPAEPPLGRPTSQVGGCAGAAESAPLQRKTRARGFATTEWSSCDYAPGRAQRNRCLACEPAWAAGSL